jgi:hypothetical protein
VKILYSVILSLIFLVFWSCSDAGKDPLSSGDETDCTQELDCNSVCGGLAINDACGVCDGNGSTCNINYSLTIQPIFTANCTSCHRTSGGLILTSYSDLMGDDVVDPGNSMTSKLIQKLKGTSGDQMPLNQDPLDDATINLIETWIDEGALEVPLDN